MSKEFLVEFGSVDGYKPETREELLNKLPKQIIKNGKIIPIRDEIQKNFEKNDAKTIAAGAMDRVIRYIISHDQCEIEGEVNISSEADRKSQRGMLSDSEAEKLINIKIRTETTRRTLLLKLLYTDKISVLYDLIKNYR